MRGTVTAFRAVQGAETWAADGGWVTAHSGVLGPGIAQRVADGATMTVEQLSCARAVVAEGRAALAARLPADTAVSLPAASSTAHRWLRHPSARPTVRAATVRLTCPAGVAGLHERGRQLARMVTNGVSVKRRRGSAISSGRSMRHLLL